MWQVAKKAVKLCLVGGASKGHLHGSAVALGRIDENLMPDFYSACDLFALPSREDNFPNTMLEAMACGVPVVSFDVGAMPEVISDWETGLIVKETNPQALREGLVDCLENLSRFEREKIRRFVIEHHSMEKLAANYIELYSKICSG